MMPTLNPPTDNLYKFIAISGLVFIGLSVYIQSDADAEKRAALAQYTKTANEVASQVFDYKADLGNKMIDYEKHKQTVPRSLVTEDLQEQLLIMKDWESGLDDIFMLSTVDYWDERI